VFTIGFVLLTLVLLIMGFYDRRTGGYNEPLSWSEYTSMLPEMIVMLLLASVVISIFEYNSHKKG
jgi:hypothetical protein